MLINFFAARRMHKCDLCCHAVTIRPSVCCVPVYVEGSKYILKLFSPSYSHAMLHRVSKNCAFLFLTERRQISTNLNMFW